MSDGNERVEWPKVQHGEGYEPPISTQELFAKAKEAGTNEHVLALLERLFEAKKVCDQRWQNSRMA